MKPVAAVRLACFFLAGFMTFAAAAMAIFASSLVGLVFADIAIVAFLVASARVLRRSERGGLGWRAMAVALMAGMLCNYLTRFLVGSSGHPDQILLTAEVASSTFLASNCAEPLVGQRGSMKYTAKKLVGGDFEVLVSWKDLPGEKDQFDHWQVKYARSMAPIALHAPMVEMMYHPTNFRFVDHGCPES